MMLEENDDHIVNERDQSELPVFYGLPLLDEDGEMRLVSKRDAWQLRRPVRGAFTGGFSAGFYNSVSSETGFEPQAFYSTRSQRTNKSSSIRKPEDFMDAEDFTVHGIAPKLIRTCDEFTLTVDNAFDLKASSKSLALLNLFGWKAGQGVGPRRPISESKRFYPESYKDATIAPKNVHSFMYVAKTDTAGIGYVGLQQKRSPDILASSSKARSFLPKGQAFGVGVLNDSDDEQDMLAYGQECMDDYDYDIGPTLKDQKEQKLSSYNDSPAFEFTGYLKNVRQQEGEQMNYKKSTNAYNPITKPPFKRRSTHLTIEERGRKLGMQRIEWESKLKSGLENRFRAKDTLDKSSNKVKDEAVEAAKLGITGKLTRIESEWIPDDATYKIFNLAMPQRSNCVSIVKPTFNVFDILCESSNEYEDKSTGMISQQRKSLGLAVPVDDQAAVILAQLDEWRNEVIEEEETICKRRRPPIDLFKAIFSDKIQDNEYEDFEKASSEENQYYGPKSPPVDFEPNSFAHLSTKYSSWEHPQIDSSMFVERDLVAEQAGNKELLDKTWQWASKGLGKQKH
ncbi:hypothetical protein GJ496_003075 [Pomphorhynchus laevis]|nr:hypothetical protein GJ496_003075 [Pomphorhynchus laevis]